MIPSSFWYFFFNDTATTEIYTLSLTTLFRSYCRHFYFLCPSSSRLWKECRSEERFSRNAETDLVCRLLLEKNNKAIRSIFDYAVARAQNDAYNSSVQSQGVVSSGFVLGKD